MQPIFSTGFYCSICQFVKIMAYSFYSPSIQTHSAKPLFHFTNLLSSSENFCGPILVEIVKLLNSVNESNILIGMIFLIRFVLKIVNFQYFKIQLIDFYPLRTTGYFGYPLFSKPK